MGQWTYLWPGFQGVLLIGLTERGNHGGLIILGLGQKGFAEVRVHEDTSQPMRSLIDVGTEFRQCILVWVPETASYEAAARLAVDVVAGVWPFPTSPRPGGRVVGLRAQVNTYFSHDDDTEFHAYLVGGGVLAEADIPIYAKDDVLQRQLGYCLI